MTDWTKFNPVEFDERQRVIQQKGVIAALTVFCVLSGIYMIFTDGLRFLNGISAVVLLSGVSYAVFNIYTAINGGFMAANAKDLGQDKINLILPCVILGFLLIMIVISIIEDGGIGFMKDGVLLTSSALMLSSVMILCSMIISTLIYRSKRKKEDSEE